MTITPWCASVENRARWSKSFITHTSFLMSCDILLCYSEVVGRLKWWFWVSLVRIGSCALQDNVIRTRLLNGEYNVMALPIGSEKIRRGITDINLLEKNHIYIDWIRGEPRVSENVVEATKLESYPWDIQLLFA